MSTTDLVAAGTYDLDAVAGIAAAMREELGDDFTPSFPRIKVPGGGATVWEDAEGNPHKELKGVLLAYRATTRLYLESFDSAGDGDRRPDAWSNDGKVQIVPPETREKAERLGLPTPLADLRACPYYKFASDGGVVLPGSNGKGKATREYRELYLLLDGQGVLPVQVNVPATSIRDFDKFVQTLFFKGGGTISGAETILGLQQQDGGGSVKYSTITFRTGSTLDPAVRESLKAYAREIRATLTSDPFVRVDQDVASNHVDEPVAEPVGVAADAEPVAVDTSDLDL